MYKIPKEDEVIRAILKTMNKNRRIESQRLYHKLVLKELKKSSPYYLASLKRIKKISSKLGEVGIFVEKRRSSKEAEHCFVCGGRFDDLEVLGLRGERKLGGKKCKECGFEIQRKKLAPKKYIFYKK